MTSGKLRGVEYLTPNEPSNGGSLGWRDVLGIALYSVADASSDAAEVPIARVNARPVCDVPALCDVWRADGSFGCVTLPEAESGANVAGGAALMQVLTRAYADVFRCLRTLGFARATRIWNYLPKIDSEVGGIGSYRPLNGGRQRAFRSANGAIRGNVPAACALGSPAGSSLVVYLLAGAGAGAAVENPRRVAAHDDPVECGAFSPTFARATIVEAASGPMLFVSGTASIRGHRTMHVGDVISQVREIIANLQAPVTEANRVAGAARFTPGRLKYNAYVRRPEDFAAVAAAFAAALRPAVSVAYLGADVCREDLLVGIEAAGGAGPGEVRRC